MITVEWIVFSNLWSSEEETSQFLRTNEIYGELAKILNSVSINLFVCVIFNLNVHLFSKKKVFFLKFLFIDVIHSIYTFNIGAICTSPLADLL